MTFRPFTIGTAGHVDHGKSALIEALTGTHPDRLPEEKKRGMSIELGFAKLELPSGRTVSVVDVPGHERFVRAMAAGVYALDLVLFVIASDEGIMPQTREHLAICELLGVKRAIIVLTKIDLVDAARLRTLEIELVNFFRGTALQAAPRRRISAKTREGLPELLAAIDAALVEIPLADPTGPFRLWVDRAFTLKGFGTIVTGTALSGEVKVDDELVHLPEAETLRVRNIEVHGKRVASARAGNRTALNLAGAERTTLARGALLTAPGTTLIGKTLLAQIKPSEKPLLGAAGE